VHEYSLTHYQPAGIFKPKIQEYDVEGSRASIRRAFRSRHNPVGGESSAAFGESGALLLILHGIGAYALAPQKRKHFAAYDDLIEMKMPEKATVLRVNSAWARLGVGTIEYLYLKNRF
jgi:hypothetical protein